MNKVERSGVAASSRRVLCIINQHLALRDNLSFIWHSLNFWVALKLCQILCLMSFNENHGLQRASWFTLVGDTHFCSSAESYDISDPDNGKEFVAGALQQWLMKLDIKPIQIYPGSS